MKLHTIYRVKSKHLDEYDLVLETTILRKALAKLNALAETFPYTTHILFKESVAIIRSAKEPGEDE